MPDDTPTNGDGRLPPKLKIRPQAAAPADSSSEPAAASEVAPPSQETARLVVQPAEEPAPRAPEPAPAGGSSLKIRPKAGSTPEPRLTIKPRAGKAETPPPTAAETGETAQESKRKTSRIPLERAKPVPTMEDPASKPKTIKIKPAVPLPKLQATQQIPLTAELPDESAETAKRLTSRIPLEDALKTGASEPSGPALAITPKAAQKTITIKRPSVGNATPAADETPAASGVEAMSKTARIDLPPEEPAEPQKKTIRLKRPGEGTAPAAPAAAQPVVQIEQRPVAADLGVFSMLGALATVVVLVLLLLCVGAQYDDGALGIPWPGKIESTN